VKPTSYQTIRYEAEPPITVLTLNRPEKRNALNPQLISELSEAFAIAGADNQCRVVLLQAEGKAFCAGMDLESLQTISSQSAEKNLEDSRQLAQLFRRIHTLPKPVIAVVAGAAVAGGCGLATVCDYTLATPEAKFGYTEVRIGFVAAIVGVFLTRQIGEKRARELLLSGRLIESAEALRLGLISEVIPAAQIPTRARHIAAELAANSPQGLATTKALLAGREALDAELEHACRVNAEARLSEDCREGVRAFLEKRPPRWAEPS
jgi:methylglutaconyl-CoA hydratase